MLFFWSQQPRSAWFTILYDIRVLGHDELHDAVARLEAADVAANHSDVLGRGRSIDSLNLHDSPCPPRQARVSNFCRRCIGGGPDGRHEIDQTMHALPRAHKPIAQVRVLVQHVRLPTGAAELELVLMLAIMHVTRARPCLEHRLKHDLRRRAAEVKHRIRRRRLGRVGADGIQEVVGRNPRVHALVAAVHNRNGVRRRKRERVHGVEAVPDGIEDLAGLLWAEEAQPRGRLDGHGGAAPERLGDGAHGDVEERVEALRGVFRASRVRRQAREFLHERLVLVCGRRPAVVEFVHVDARARRACVDHERVLHEGRGWVVWCGAEDGFAWVWVGLVRAGPRGRGLGASWFRDDCIIHLRLVWLDHGRRLGIHRSFPFCTRIYQFLLSP